MEVPLPNVAELEDQFVAQQNMIEQMRDTLLQREQTVSSNEKKVQDYAATLTRIRSSHRPNKKKDDIANSSALDITPEKGPSSKISLLRQQMEENRAILEQRGKLINEHKQSVEGMVEMLSAQLTEKDLALEEVRRSRAQASLPHINPSSEESRELYSQVIARDNKIIELNNKIMELETSIINYEESLRENESVLDARTRAVALLQKDLGLKHSTALQHLEEARQEAARLKTSLAEKEQQLKVEKQALLDTLASREHKLTELEAVRFDLCTRNAELQHKVVALQTKSHEVLSQGLPQDKDKIQELESKISDIETSTSDEIDALKLKIEESSKLLTKAKVAYSKKIKLLEQKLSKQNVQEIEQKIAELEEEKGNLQLMLVDFEEIKASEKLLRQKVCDMEAQTEEQKLQLETQTKTIDELEGTNSMTHKELQEQRALVAELQAELEAAKHMVQESECAAVRANMKTVELEERLENAEKDYTEMTAEVEKLLAQKESADNTKQVQDVLDSAEKDKDSLQSSVENLKAQLAAQEVVSREAAEALQHVQQMLSLKTTEHEAEIESLQAQIASKEERCSHLEERISSLSEESQKSLAQLDQSMVEAHEAQEALCKAESVVNQEGSRLELAEHKMQSLERQIAELQMSLAQANQIQQDESQARSHAQEEVRELRSQLEVYAVQLESASDTLTTLDALKVEHSKMLKKYHDEVASWKLRAEQAEEEVSASAILADQKFKEHHVAMEGWNQEMETLQNHIAGLEEADSELHEKIENLGLEKESVESELWSVQEELANATAAASQLQVSEDALQQAELEKQALEEQIRNHLAKISELEKSLTQVQSEARDHQSALLTLQGEMQKLQLAKNAAEETCNIVKAELQSSVDTLQLLREESEKVHAANEELQAKLNVNQNQDINVQNLNAQVVALNNEIEQLRWALGERDQALQAWSQQNQTYADMGQHVKSLEDSLAQSGQQIQFLSSSLENSQVQISSLQSQASEKETAASQRVSELETANYNLQNSIDQQKVFFERQASQFKAEVDKLNQQLIEAQTATKTTMLSDEISWGEEPSWQEPAHQPTVMDNSSALLIEALQKQLKEAEDSQAKLSEDLRASQVRCGKALKQLKMLKDQNKQPSQPSDLSKVMEEELQLQIASLQKELKDVKTELSSVESKAEMLRDANNRLTESKKNVDLEIERLKIERLALEEEASDWGQDDRIVALEKQLRDAYDRCKDLEEQIVGDENESFVLQESLVKSRDRCAELEQMRLADEEKLQLLEKQLAFAVEQTESMQAPIIKSFVEVSSEPEHLPAASPIIPQFDEVSTMTEEVVCNEVAVNTEQLPAEVPEAVPAPVVTAPAPAFTTPAEALSADLEAVSFEMAKLRAKLSEKQQEGEALAALVTQLQSALESKSQELHSRSGDPNLRLDLDSALYLLHQRDVRCDELTLELMALMEERDGLQLRLSSALRLNAAQAEQLKETGIPEDLQPKLSELHSVGHKRDITLKGEQEVRHSEQTAALLTTPSLHFTPNQRTLQIDDNPPQQASSGLMGWLWGY